MTFPKPRQAVILVGGLGTRLGDLTTDKPKPLLEVGGRPFLDLLVREAHRFGCKDILLLAGYRAEKVRLFANDHPLASEIRLSVLVEEQPLGTAGALRQSAPQLQDVFFLLNGDSWFDTNWYRLTMAGRAGTAYLGAILLRHIPDARRFGVVDIEGGYIVRFRPRGDADGGLVNAGVYLMRKEIVPFLADASSLEGEVLPQLAAAGQLAGHVGEGYFVDIGVPDSFAEAQIIVPRARSRPAVFFDRDGVLNHDFGYVHRAADFRWITNAMRAIAEVNDCGFQAFVVSNQAGVAHGYYGIKEIAALQAYMEVELHAAGAFVDDFRYCPHHPQGKVPEYSIVCNCRKPKPGMLRALIDKWEVRKDMSILIGDKPTDLDAAREAGLRGFLFKGGDLHQFMQSCCHWRDWRVQIMDQGAP